VLATYDPAVDTALCDQFAAGPVFPGVPICADGVGAIAANVPAPITTIIDTPIGDYKRSMLVMTTPGAAALNEGPGHPLFGPDAGADEDGAGPATCADLLDNGGDTVADAADPDCMSPALGDFLGQSLMAVNLGAANGICALALVDDFPLINATVAIGAPIDPIPQALAGAAGVLENMQSDDGAAATAAPGYVPPPGILVDGLPAAVNMYPSYLNTMFDPDLATYGPDLLPGTIDDVNGPAPPVQPLQRLHAGVLFVGAAVEINLVTFAPGALAAVFPAPHPYADLTADMGYTTIVVVDDPTQPAAPTAITDNCTDDFTVITTFGEAHFNPCNLGFPPPSPGPCDTPAEINDPPVGPVTFQDRARTPPMAGTYLYLTYSHTFRDADEDGLENPLDTCAGLATGPTFDPRFFGLDDPEPDMLPGGGPAGGCDPAPAVDFPPGNTDGDIAPNGALWLNAGDNCPLAPNAAQTDAELTMDVYAAFAANPAPQGGPKSDGIGDACDLDVVAEVACADALDSDFDGLVNDGCPMVGAFSEAGIAGGCTNAIDEPDEDPGPPVVGDDAVVNDGCPVQTIKASGDYLVDLDATAKCIGGVDGDDDGYCAVAGAGVATFDTADGAPLITPEDYDLVFPAAMAHSGAGAAPPERQPVQVCNDGIDNDGDALVDNLDQLAGNSTCRPVGLPVHPGFPACPVPGCTVDSDGDGFRDEAERHVGTNALGRCGPGAVPAVSIAWPIDFVSGGVPASTDKITITDLTSFLAPVRRLDTAPGDVSIPADPDAFDVRWDLTPGPAVGVSWIAIGDLTALFAGPTGFPPMSGGAKVFGTAFVCSAHPTFGR
jgi:hypothetical protein